uniref:Uncharacterized protein n=1 Tax=Bracon brevicornis TaxID=1563983 RepID=A0A6V7LZ98_9HYME
MMQCSWEAAKFAKKHNIGNHHPMVIVEILMKHQVADFRIDRREAKLMEITYFNYKEANELGNHQRKWVPRNWMPKSQIINSPELSFEKASKKTGMKRK